MLVAILAQGRECLDKAWGLERGRQYPYPFLVLAWSVSQCGGCAHLVVTLCYSLERLVAGLGKGRFTIAPSTPNSTVLQLWRGGALPVRHGITGQGQAPGTL